jgi:hypothetical protein
MASAVPLVVGKVVSPIAVSAATGSPATIVGVVWR